MTLSHLIHIRPRRLARSWHPAACGADASAPYVTVVRNIANIRRPAATFPLMQAS